jgi:membrane protease YdiL (CAAX protease family)
MLFSPVLGRWNFLDLVLVVLLTVGLWTWRIYQSRQSTPAAPRSLANQLKRSAAIIGLPLLLLLADWLCAGRNATPLGLSLFPSASGLIGLGIAALIVIGLQISYWLDWPKPSAEKRAEGLALLKKTGLAPQSGKEMVYAVLLAFLIGCGTEVLFRGFLIWAFAPVFGLWGAVAVSSLAYGLGHGDDNWRRLLASTVSAAIFAIAFGLTASLWWLMLIHTFVGLQAAWIGYRGSATP